MNQTLIQSGLCRDANGGSLAMIDRLDEERSAVLDFIERTASQAQEAGRDLTESERTTLTSSRERLAQNGVLPLDSVPIEGFERFEARDPFGNRIEMIQAVQS